MYSFPLEIYRQTYKVIYGDIIFASQNMYMFNCIRNDQFYTMVVPFYTPISNIRAPHSLHIFANNCYCWSFPVITKILVSMGNNISEEDFHKSLV